ncbi:maestro heat-like repeat-containing protein family member 7 isoform X3 [Caretta caretta]|uniref:maestro heat-like repeat-containing protein family member 7 isoform X3 n=1 Tax=Caretta caretta TaxID=8467 RepID=UPI003F4C91F6
MGQQLHLGFGQQRGRWALLLFSRDSEDDEEEQVDVATEEAALKNIQEQLQGREKELIEELPDNSPPGAILANSLIAVGNLSTMTPALEPDLETYLLRAALHAVFTLGTEKDTTQVQDLHRVLPDLLDAMLGNLLAEALDTGRLHYILEHINYWIVSRVSQERARAIRSSTLPEFDNSAEFPRMGHHVAQLALFIGDPAKDISRQAREGVYLLYQLLLHQRSKEPSWEMAPDRRVRLGP